MLTFRGIRRLGVNKLNVDVDSDGFRAGDVEVYRVYCLLN